MDDRISNENSAIVSTVKSKRSCLESMFSSGGCTSGHPVHLCFRSHYRLHYSGQTFATQRQALESMQDANSERICTPRDSPPSALKYSSVAESGPARMEVIRSRANGTTFTIRIMPLFTVTRPISKCTPRTEAPIRLKDHAAYRQMAITLNALDPSFTTDNSSVFDSR